MRKEERELRKVADRWGFTLIEWKTHFKWKHPSGAQVTTGMTISDHRARRNIEAQFRKALINNR
jgi:hypothetical protein|tara:strand:- start:374 stop:565 length:192 start_codon:yes stop_codon:yes gene_type:complete